jgi:glutamate 5-kinase
MLIARVGNAYLPTVWRQLLKSAWAQKACPPYLAVGVKAVRGKFKRGDLVSCLDGQGREIARGLINYGAEEAVKIAGKPSSEFEALLGYADDELIHQDNLVLI